MEKTILQILGTAYPFPPAALEAIQPLKDYAEAALTTAAFTAHTNLPLTEENVMVRPPPTPDPTPNPATPPLHISPIRPLSTPGVKTKPRTTGRQHQTLHDRPRDGQDTRVPPGPPAAGDTAAPAHKTLAPCLAPPADTRLPHSDSTHAPADEKSPLLSTPTVSCKQLFLNTPPCVPRSRTGGGQPLSTPAVTRPHARPHRAPTTLHMHKHITAPTTAITPEADLPAIHRIEDWETLLQTHSPESFASIANRYKNSECTPVTDRSAADLITPDLIQHFVHGNWQGTMEVQDCLKGIFNLLRINPSISLLLQHEIDQILLQGEAPHRWKTQRHFTSRDPSGNPAAIPTCCGPWHNGANHFLTFYLCQDYWTLLDPLSPAPETRAVFEEQLHNALKESFFERGFAPPALPP